MFPEILRLPALDWSVPTYGVLLVAAFLSATWLAVRLAEREAIGSRVIYNLVAYIVPTSLLGTRALVVFAERAADRSSMKIGPIIDHSTGVGAFWGGFIVSAAVSVAVLWVSKKPILRVADVIAPGLALGNAVGRLGCLAGGCCWGKPTTSWVGVKFTERAHEMTGVPSGVALVPTQLIQSLVSVLSLFLLLKLIEQRSFSGQVILLYCVLYSIERFVVDFWRDDPRGGVMGLSTSQLISLGVVPATVALYAYLWGRNRRCQAELTGGSKH